MSPRRALYAFPTLVLAAAGVMWAARPSAGEESPADAAILPRVVLRTGHVIVGRVVATEVTAAGAALRLETDLTTVLVPATWVSKRLAQEPSSPDAAFRPRQWWVARIRGVVERQRPPGREWVPVAWSPTAYGAFVNAPNVLVRPGDRIRTGPDGELDLVPHAKVVVRVGPGSEVELPDLTPGPTSLGLLSGTALTALQGRPRGETFRLGTPSGVLGAKGTRFGCIVRTTTSVFASEGVVTVDGAGDIVAGRALTLVPGGPSTERGLAAEETALLRTLDDAHVSFPEVVLVPGGRYRLSGTPAPLDDLPADLRSQLEFHAGSDHKTKEVKLEPFLIERYAMTAADLRACAEALASGTEGLVNPRAIQRMARRPTHPLDAAESDVLSAMVPRPDAQRDGEQPTDCPSWLQADLVARWRGRQLPTEAQWEVAARGPKSTYWPWGSQLGRAEYDLLADAGARLSVGGQPRPVTSPTADTSAFGASGMITSGDTWMREFADEATLTDADWLTALPHHALRRRALTTRRTSHVSLGRTSRGEGATVRCVVDLAVITEAAGR